MSTFEEITEIIVRARLSEDELLRLNKVVVSELKEERARQSRRAVAALQEGDTVEVTGRLRGNAYLGQTAEVVKVNRTRVVCKFDGELRSVTIPASVLTKVGA